MFWTTFLKFDDLSFHKLISRKRFLMCLYIAKDLYIRLYYIDIMEIDDLEII